MKIKSMLFVAILSIAILCFAAPASATTDQELRVQIVKLQAQLQALQANNSSSAVKATISQAYDIDGNYIINAKTDGVLISRYLFNPNGSWKISDVLGQNATRDTVDKVRNYLNCLSTNSSLDIDGNGKNDALTDGILISRYMSGYTGTQLIRGAIGAKATRKTAALIVSFMNNVSAGNCGTDNYQSSITVTKNSAVADGTISSNATGVKIGSFIVQNTSTTESVRLAELNVKNTDVSNISKIWTSVTTGNGSTQFKPTGNDTFSVNDVLTSGASMIVDIYANTGAATSGTIRTSLSVASTSLISDAISRTSSVAGQVMTVSASTTPSITVTSPNGGETWKVGETHKIEWNSTGLLSTDHVAAYLYVYGNSSDTASTSSLIGDNALQSNTYYNWTIPATMNDGTNIGNTGKRYKIFLTVSRNGSGLVQDMGDNYFTIAAADNQTPQEKVFAALDANSDGTITGDEAVKGFNAFGTTWHKSTGDSGFNSAFDFDNNGKIDFVDYGYLSSVFSTLSTNAQREVNMFTALDKAASGGTTDLILTNQEALIGWSAFQASWLKKTGDTGFVLNFDVDKNGTISMGDFGYLSAVWGALGFPTPPQSPTTQPSITVTSPNGGEIWVAGSTHNITWTYNGTSSLLIELCRDSISTCWHLAYNIPSTQNSYSWTVDSVLPVDSINQSSVASGYKIHVQEQMNAAVSDYSDNYFTIAAASTTPSITVTSPNGGETWRAGETHKIKWSSSNFGSLKVNINLLQYDDDGQHIISNIATSIPNTGSYNWTILESIASTKSNLKIFIGSDDANPSAQDVSDNYFTIAAAADCTNKPAICKSGTTCYKGSCTKNSSITVTCSDGQKIGDVDGDGVIAKNDASLLLAMLPGLISKPSNICCVDANSDKKVSTGDATYILRIVAGTNNSPGVCSSTTSSTPLCPTGTKWNSTILEPVSNDYPYGRGYCVGNPTCPTGTKWNSTILEPVSNDYPYGRGACAGKTSQPCPSGQNWYDEKNICVSTDNHCPSGQDFEDSKNACMAKMFCPSGQDFEDSKNACMAKPFCQSGQNFDDQQNKCVGTSTALNLSQNGMASIYDAIKRIAQKIQSLFGK